MAHGAHDEEAELCNEFDMHRGGRGRGGGYNRGGGAFNLRHEHSLHEHYPAQRALLFASHAHLPMVLVI